MICLYFYFLKKKIIKFSVEIFTALMTETAEMSANEYV